MRCRSAPPPDEPPGRVARTACTQAEALEVVDADGNVRARPGLGPDGALSLDLADAAGMVRATLTVEPAGSAALKLADAAGSFRLAAGSWLDGRTSVEFWDRDGSYRAGFGTWPDGATGAGTIRTRLGQRAEGPATLELYGAGGEFKIALGEYPDGAGRLNLWTSAATRSPAASSELAGAPVVGSVRGMSSPEDGADPDPAIDVVATVGALDPTVVLLREFLHRSGAIRAVAVVELEDDVALVDVGRLLPVEVTIGERVVQLPHALQLDAAALMVPEVKQLPAFDVDQATGEVNSPLGGLEHYAIAVRQLAQILGADNVALATWETTSPEVPLSISARASEDVLVLALDEEEFEMEPGWPVDTRG